MPVLAIIAVVLIAVLLVGAVSSCSSAPADATPQETDQPTPLSIRYNPTIKGIDSVSDPGTSVTGISLADSSACYVPQLSSEGQTEVQNAISAITGSGKTVGFALVDMDTGSGYVYNLDQRVYGASSFKGHILIYGCQQALETGQTSMAKVNANAQSAIIDSDNNSYYRMRRQFEGAASQSLSAWLQSMNISESLANDTSFPHYSARESLKLWMNAYLYLNSSDSNQEITSWAKKMFSSTEVSMIRYGIDPSSDLATQERVNSALQELRGALLGKLETVDTGSAETESGNSGSVTVYDKAGWINGTEDDAVCDAGIIEENGKTYLITIMSNLPDGDSNRIKISTLASVLWNQRASLVPEQGFTKA